MLAVLLACYIAAAAQTLPPNHEAPLDSNSNFVVHINVNLVQVDVTVTDKKGRPVTGLAPEDFEVMQDGVPQKITNFSYIAAASSVPEANNIVKPQTRAPSTPLPPVPLKPDQVRRSIALVVDDLGLSFSSTARVRDALRRFVDRDMGPGDLVAIVRTGAGIGALQQFTNDKRLLYAAIDRVRFNFNTRARSFALATASSSAGSQDDANPFGKASSAAYACQGIVGSNTGSVGAIRYVVQGLSELPGRKALILFSESMQMQLSLAQVQNDNNPLCDYSRVLDAMRRLADAAERASVVVYTVDPRGVDTVEPDAAFNLSDPKGTGVISPSPSPNGEGMAAGSVSSSVDAQQRVEQSANDKLDDTRATQQGLEFLAEETGGTFVFHNDIAGAVRDAVEDAGTYYLLGYHPPASTFEGKDSAMKFHRITVRVKRPGLTARSRKGFFGFPGGEPTPTSSTSQAQFARVLSSPFAENSIHVRMTTLFTYTGKSAITTLLYVDGKDLTFTPQPDGTRTLNLEAVALTFDANGQILDNSERTLVMRGNERQCALAIQNGIILTILHAVQKPGPYQMRVAVRDSASNKIGSASEFVEVPDLKHGHLAVSGILLTEQGTGTSGVTSGTSPTAATDPKGNAAIRIFRPGEAITWGIQIFNAHRHSGEPSNLTVEARLFHDNNEIYQGKPEPVSYPTSGASQVAAFGGIHLGKTFGAGDYVLQLVVNDGDAKKKYSAASQWIEFEVASP